MSETKKQKTKSSQKVVDKSRRSKRFKADVESMLVEGESIVEQGIISDGIYWKAAAVFVIALLFAFFLAIELGVLLVVVVILMVVYATMLKGILMFTLTDRRIFVRTGILQVDVIDIRFSKIESIELQRMLPGYILGYSNVVVMGTGNRYIVIPYVSNGVEIRRSYNRLTLSDEDE